MAHIANDGLPFVYCLVAGRHPHAGTITVTDIDIDIDTTMASPSEVTSAGPIRGRWWWPQPTRGLDVGVRRRPGPAASAAPADTTNHFSSWQRTTRDC